MAIQTRIINELYTEIYVGGGNFITQSKPTNFHKFYTRKILTESESIDDFREVTASEKATLEAADAAWVRPPQSFIDAWNARADFSANGKYPQYIFGKYNEETGYFELNTILDIDYAEAINIMAYAGMKSLGDNYTGPIYPQDPLRTMMPIKHGIGLSSSMESNIHIQTYQIFGYYGPWVNVAKKCSIFNNCRSLHTILGIIYNYDSISFGGCGNITNVKIISKYYDGKTVDLSPAHLLSLESINYTIENSTKSLTIILHPDAYARVTEEIFAAAAQKNITIATT